MADYYRTRGFVIAKTDFREADQILKVYTKDFGKLEVVGRAIRKIKSKLRAGIDLFYFSEIEFVQGKAHKTLTDSLKIERFENIRKDIKKIETAAKIAKTADDLIRSQEKDEKVFVLLEDAFNKLNQCDSKNKDFCQIVYYHFFWKLASLLGYHINLYTCASCHSQLKPSAVYFNFKDGGIVCQSCFKTETCESISCDAVKIIRIILNDDWQTILKLKISPDYESGLKDMCRGLYSFSSNI